MDIRISMLMNQYGGGINASVPLSQLNRYVGQTRSNVGVTSDKEVILLSADGTPSIMTLSQTNQSNPSIPAPDPYIEYIPPTGPPAFLIISGDTGYVTPKQVTNYFNAMQGAGYIDFDLSNIKQVYKYYVESGNQYVHIDYLPISISYNYSGNPYTHLYLKPFVTVDTNSDPWTIDNTFNEFAQPVHKVKLLGYPSTANLTFVASLGIGDDYGGNYTFNDVKFGDELDFTNPDSYHSYGYKYDNSGKHTREPVAPEAGIVDHIHSPLRLLYIMSSDSFTLTDIQYIAQQQDAGQKFIHNYIRYKDFTTNTTNSTYTDTANPYLLLSFPTNYYVAPPIPITINIPIVQKTSSELTSVTIAINTMLRVGIPFNI